MKDPRAKTVTLDLLRQLYGDAPVLSEAEAYAKAECEEGSAERDALAALGVPFRRDTCRRQPASRPPIVMLPAVVPRRLANRGTEL
jgi:hypothetical protein